MKLLFGMLSRLDDDGEGSDGERAYPAALNRLAVVAFVGAALVGAGGLFAVPFLQDTGLSFREAFAIVGVAEFAAAVVAAVAGYHLYATPAE